MVDGFSVIMPTYNQAGFIKRAIRSLLRQTFPTWELIIINDGCTDGTEELIREFLGDARVTYVKNYRNRGLGYSVNVGLGMARYGHIAYLPSDDYYDPQHLCSLADHFEKYDNAVLVFSGIRHGIRDTMTFSARTTSAKLMHDHGMQMVQVAHKKTDDRWVERGEWEDKDLGVTFWNKLLDKGSFVSTRTASCFFTFHNKQRHRLITEGQHGGLNIFRAHYKIEEPLKVRFHKKKFIDEETGYADFRKSHDVKPDGLKILLVGELAYNPERIYALEQAGHKLYGLWVNSKFYGYNTVGPLPFGNVEDIDCRNWRQRVREIKPDIIYAMLNFPAIPLAYDVLKENPDIPFVWHFKEAATISLQLGTWDKLMYLYNNADGVIHISRMVQDWVELFASPKASIIMDGDLPHADHFDKPFSPKLSDTDSQAHIVLTGRLIGLKVNDMEKLAENGVHLHLYTQAKHQQRESGNEKMMEVAPGHFHVHSHCGAGDWVREFSRYDAGLLHLFTSKNYGSLYRASWDDLNIPARMATYAAAGLPMILKCNEGHMTSTNSITEELGIGIPYNTIDDLVRQLKNKPLMKQRRDNVLLCRDRFTFNNHVPRLMDFFKDLIDKKKNETCR